MFEFIEDEALRTKVTEEFNNGVKSQIDEVKNSLQEEFNTNIEGLKTKNQELLDEKKKLQQKFEGIENPEDALEALKLVTENEEIKLIKEGKFEEVIERRLSGVKSEHEEEIGKLLDQIKETSTSAEKYKGLFESKTIDDALRDAAGKAGVEGHAIEDVLNSGRLIFSVGEDGSVEARGRDGKLLKTEDDKILSPGNWIEERKTVSPHWWPRSESGGFNPDLASMDDLDRKILEASQRGDSKEYRRLRDKKKELRVS